MLLTNLGNLTKPSLPHVTVSGNARMGKLSAGILLYRNRNGVLQVFLVHPGGPHWAGRDHGAWSVPKGEFGRDEDPLTAARREFEEETGFPINGEFAALAPIKQPSGKTIHVWAIAGDRNHRKIHSNTFTMEWPPRSGKVEEFPEVDRAKWFDISEARLRIVSGQLGFLNELEALLNAKATLR